MSLDGAAKQLYPHSWRILILRDSATRHRQDTPPSIQRVTNLARHQLSDIARSSGVTGGYKIF